MGNRVTCYLDIGGAIPRSLANRIMTGEFGFPEYGGFGATVEPFNQHVEPGPWKIVFQEVKYAELPDELAKALGEANLPFIWRWAAGDEHEAGAKWWVPGQVGMKDTSLNDGAQMVAVSLLQEREAAHPGILVSELLASLDLMPDLPPATFVEDVPVIKVGPEPEPQTFTVIQKDGRHQVVEAVDQWAARRQIDPEGFTVAAVIKGRCVVIGAE